MFDSLNFSVFSNGGVGEIVYFGTKSTIGAKSRTGSTSILFSTLEFRRSTFARSFGGFGGTSFVLKTSVIGAVSGFFYKFKDSDMITSMA
jgi:hypothetical protein